MMFEKIKIRESVDLYRNNINFNSHSVNDYINLVLLLWNISFDYGLESDCITKEIFTKNEISNFSTEIEKLFSNASEAYPNNKELQFWKLYIDDLSTYSECSHKEYMYNYLDRHNFYFPHFYLFVQCGILNIEQLKQLKVSLMKEEDSYKKYYVLSYLEDIEINPG